LAIGFDKSFLRNVLGGMVVAEDAPGHGMHLAFITPHQGGVGVAITSQHRADKLVVALHAWDGLLGLDFQWDFQRRHILIDERRSSFAAGIARNFNNGDPGTWPAGRER
jgi:hypothetical protein